LYREGSEFSMTDDLIKVSEAALEHNVNAEGNTPGVLVGPAYDFLFEGEDNQYDRKYEHYI
jgi:hypothetical protein